MTSTSIVFCFLAIFLTVIICESQALQTGDVGVCEVNTSVMDRRKVRYFTTVWCHRGRRCRVARVKFETFKRWTNHTVCCQGWQHDAELDACKPMCSLGCINGTCVAPSTCYCDPPMHLDGQNKCVAPVCDQPCVNSFCVGSNQCECVNNTRRYNETHCAFCDENYTIGADLTCTPQCLNPCVNSTCVAPDKCKCLDGFTQKDDFNCEPHCDQCVNSVCVSPNQCACFPGYTSLNQTVCVAKCDDCEDGECVRPGVCVCREGYRLVEGDCEPVCSKPCVNGYCSAPEECTCYVDHVRNVTSGGNEVCCRPECGGVCDLNGECPAVACVPRKNGIRVYLPTCFV